MNLLFCINQKALGELACCLKSIHLHGGYEHYEVYLLHSSLDKTTWEALNKDYGKTMTFHFIELPEILFEDFPTTDRYPKEIYYRLIAPQFLPDEMERILYLDADTIVINSLESLYETDFEGNYFAGCTHTKQLLTKINQSRLHTDKASAYINTGVLLYNLPLLREYVSFQEIRKYVVYNAKKLILPDQDILSSLYGDKVKLLDTMRYNLSDRVLHQYNAIHWHHKIDIDWIRENTVIVHYCGTNKPWHQDYMGKLGVFYQELLPETCRSHNS